MARKSFKPSYFIQDIARPGNALNPSYFVQDIVWPGNALKPPEGVPERRFLTITFLEVTLRFLFNFELCRIPNITSSKTNS